MRLEEKSSLKFPPTNLSKNQLTKKADGVWQKYTNTNTTPHYLQGLLIDVKSILGSIIRVKTCCCEKCCKNARKSITPLKLVTYFQRWLLLAGVAGEQQPLTTRVALQKPSPVHTPAPEAATTTATTTTTTTTTSSTAAFVQTSRQFVDRQLGRRRSSVTVDVDDDDDDDDAVCSEATLRRDAVVRRGCVAAGLDPHLFRGQDLDQEPRLDDKSLFVQVSWRCDNPSIEKLPSIKNDSNLQSPNLKETAEPNTYNFLRLILFSLFVLNKFGQ